MSPGRARSDAHPSGPRKSSWLGGGGGGTGQVKTRTLSTPSRRTKLQRGGWRGREEGTQRRTLPHGDKQRCVQRETSAWSPRGAKRERSAETQHSELGVERGSENNPDSVSAQSGLGAQAPETTAFLPQQSEASGTPKRPPPPLLTTCWATKGGVARSAPRGAAPTSWRKYSFPKPELGTSVLLTVFC